MKWDEFCSLLRGLSPESALGRIVQIRAESDPDILKQYTPNQKKIREEWLAKTLDKKPDARLVAERDHMLEIWKQAFISASGGDTDGG